MRLVRLALLFLAQSIGTAHVTLVVAMASTVERVLGLSHAAFVVAAYYGALALVHCGCRFE